MSAGSDKNKWACSFVVSGPLEVLPKHNVTLFGEIYRPRGGRFFPTVTAALNWIKTKYLVLEVITDAEIYGNRWAFRVVRLEKGARNCTRPSVGKND